MTSVLTSLIAVAGTLLGAMLGGFFQRRSTDRSEQRRAALAYANTITKVILNQQDRWHRSNENPGGPEALAAEQESHRLRNTARQAMNEVIMLIPARALLDQAQATFDAASDVHRATTAAERTARAKAAHQSVRAFISLARKSIH